MIRTRTAPPPAAPDQRGLSFHTHAPPALTLHVDSLHVTTRNGNIACTMLSSQCTTRYVRFGGGLEFASFWKQCSSSQTCSRRFLRSRIAQSAWIVIFPHPGCVAVWLCGFVSRTHRRCIGRLPALCAHTCVWARGLALFLARSLSFSLALFLSRSLSHGDEMRNVMLLQVLV